LHDVNDINYLKQYFVNSFRYFTKANPIQMLGEFEAGSSDASYIKFCRWIREKCPNVSRGLVPLSQEEFVTLIESFGGKELGGRRVFEAIKQINERVDIIPKYFTLYRLTIKWIENENRKR
ncbi:MAG: hypothetical protein K2G90_05955, partial [Muribaculaceae bacterium]|nr:hypothetical protein [Muribaculaceae bacterium]